jgi:glyoxylase-like metal-dependent hydrolase (beta-lactamase superfamily II)/rhodanese-related sulfurtransferase
MFFRQLIDPETSTWTYLLADPVSRQAVIIDPVLEQLDRDLAQLAELEFTLLYALDTHVHADHVTALGSLRKQLAAKTVVSAKSGSGCPDLFVRDGDILRFGSYGLTVRETPGHTNGCVSYVTLDQKMAFTGDALLIRGCGRTDFQQGSAARLFHSVRSQLFSLPDDCLVYPGHDYKGRTCSTIAEEKRHNPRLGLHKSEAEFVAIMADLKLAYPKRIDVALPTNLQCGLATPAPVDGSTPACRTWAPVERTTDNIPELPVEWVALHRAAARLVDVREPSELVGPLGLIDGAVNVPLSTLSQVATTWDKAQPVLLVCGTGRRSGQGARTLEALGFEQVASLRGGMTAWNAQTLPALL